MTNRVALRLNFAKKAALAGAGMAAVAAPIMVGTLNAPAATLKFDVASVKPCRADVAPGGRKGASSSPGRLHPPCQTVMGLIQWAYVNFAKGHFI